MDDYAKLAWGLMGTELVSSATSQDAFLDGWSTLLEKELGIDKIEVLLLFTSEDTHRSERRSRDTWDYGTSLGYAGTPSGQLNGVRLTNYPQSTDEWKALLKEVYP